MPTEPPTESIPPATSNTDEQLSEADSAAIAAAMAEDAVPTAKSLKCVDCGKLFKNADLANYHAEKSGHENFEESVDEVLYQHIYNLFRLNLLRKKKRKLNWKS
jgi:UBX domain-containing protein 1/4